MCVRVYVCVDYLDDLQVPHVEARERHDHGHDPDGGDGGGGAVGRVAGTDGHRHSVEAVTGHGHQCEHRHGKGSH